jgi:hypothetical protein
MLTKGAQMREQGCLLHYLHYQNIANHPSTCAYQKKDNNKSAYLKIPHP